VTIQTQSESFTNFITALCLLGHVNVRPSKTGLRIALVSKDQTAAFITRALINEDNTGYTITTQLHDGESDKISEKISHDTLHAAYVAISVEADVAWFGIGHDNSYIMKDFDGADPLTPMLISSLCQDNIVMVRASKTGARIFAMNKDSLATAKLRIVNNSFSLGRTNDEGEFIGDSPIVLSFEENTPTNDIALIMSQLTKHEVAVH
jgi:hypothetical protein